MTPFCFKRVPHFVWQSIIATLSLSDKGVFAGINQQARGVVKHDNAYQAALVDWVEGNDALSAHQKKHVKANLTSIFKNTLSLVTAIEGSSLNVLEGLSDEQLTGIDIGLTHMQVDNPWYSKKHTQMIENGTPYDAIAGLFYYKLMGIKAGLTRGYVSASSYHHKQISVMQDKGLTYNDVKGLFDAKLEGIALGLMREDVDHPWFNHLHVYAIKSKKLHYADVKGLSTQQLGTKLRALKSAGDKRLSSLVSRR